MAAPDRPIGNWTPGGENERDRLRRDYLELKPAQRVKQVCELSRFMSRVDDAGLGYRVQAPRSRRPVA
jgi:hypothetical protein